MTLADAARGRFSRVTFALAAGGCFGAVLYALLRREIFQGQTQSFDTLLYARSLWGVAHGDLWNPVIGAHVLAIHVQLWLWPLAPWAQWLGAAQTLVLAQAAALGCTVALLVAAFVQQWPSPDAGEQLLCALWVVLVFAVGCPLLSNPMLFDARPETVAVPCLTWALLRAVRRKRVDAAGLAGILAAVAAREEFALAAAAGLLLMPTAERARRVRWAIALLAYFALVYALTHRGLRSQQLHWSSATEPISALLAHKATWLCVTLATGGGLALRGYRWLGAALPGAAFVLSSRWLPQAELSLHYDMFVVPGLLAAAYAGYRDVLGRPHVRAQLAAHGAVAVACYAFASAWPGGARFAREYFDVTGPPLSPTSYLQHTSWLRDVHATLASLPRADALIVPYMFGAPLADRARIESLEGVERELISNRAALRGIDSVALLRKDWFRLGHALRERGFALTALSGLNLAVLSRRGPALDLRKSPGVASCNGVAVRWPSAGIGLCNIWVTRDGRAQAVFVRLGADTTASDVRALIETRGADDHRLWPLDGLISLHDMPLGVPLPAESREPLNATRVRVALVDTTGKALAVEPATSTNNSVALQLRRD